MSKDNRPNTLWPIGSQVEFLDAYGRNPVPGTIIRHYDASNVLVEDERGVVYFGATWRISTNPPINDLLSDLM